VLSCDDVLGDYVIVHVEGPVCAFNADFGKFYPGRGQALTIKPVYCRDIDDDTLSFFSVAQLSLVGQGLLVVEVLRSHSDTPHFSGRVIGLQQRPLPDSTQHCL